MNLLPTLTTQPASPPPPILLLLLPEHCSSTSTVLTIKMKTEQPIVRSRGTAFSISYEFVYTPNHQHDGINE